MLFTCRRSLRTTVTSEEKLKSKKWQPTYDTNESSSFSSLRLRVFEDLSAVSPQRCP